MYPIVIVVVRFLFYKYEYKLFPFKHKKNTIQFNVYGQTFSDEIFISLEF